MPTEDWSCVVDWSAVVPTEASWKWFSEVIGVQVVLIRAAAARSRTGPWKRGSEEVQTRSEVRGQGGSHFCECGARVLRLRLVGFWGQEDSWLWIVSKYMDAVCVCVCVCVCCVEAQSSSREQTLLDPAVSP